MASVSKNVTIFPAAAAAAGCAASCAGTQTDYQDGSWLREYQLSAAAQGGWNFVSFEWDTTTTTSEGGTTTTHNTSRFNPEGQREFRTYFGSASLWEEVTISNIVANFSQTQTYTITTAVSPAGGGTTTGDGTYAAGASCTITATPAAGYTFVRWEKNGAQVSTSASYTFTVSESATYTAVFSDDVVTITLVVHNGMGWGYVGFVGGQSSSQQISKTFQRGSQFTIEATRDPVNFSEFKIWRWRSGSISSTNSTITGWATADETYTAYFAFPITASARLLDDNTKPCPQGEVLITYLETPQTPWAQDVSYERTEPGIIKCRQRSTGGGWTFVKWLWRNHPSAEWYTSTNQDLLADNAKRFEAIALFKRFATHLLVNSSARATPVQLVYDPATNKLVADY